MKITPSLVKHLSNNLLIFGAGIVLLFSALFPMMMPRNALAAQISSRSLTISTAIPSATADYTFNFTVPSATVVKSLSATACTTAVGSCTTPGGFSVTGTTIDQPTNLGDASGWTVDTSTAGSLRLSKSGNVAAPTGSQTVVFHGVTNPSATNTAFFLRITTYSDASWTTSIDTGTTASATTISPAFTVNAAVAEILNFCVGSTSADDATSDVTAGADDCSGVSGTDVNLGTLDTASISTTPIPINPNGGDNENGLAMLRTNAGNGASVSYKAVQAGSGTNHLGTLRITGGVCSAGADSTDPCIDAQGVTQGTFTAGTEKFGMTVGGTNCSGVSPTSYSCALASGTNRLKASSNYIGATATSYGTSAGFAWDESGTARQIASSTTVVDDEALVLKFAATPSITTPFGAYSVKADFIAVTTY